MELTVKELAQQLGVTTAAVHNQLKRHPEEMEGHFHREGRAIVVDDAAQTFIKERALHKVETEVMTKSAAEELQQLRDDKIRLLEQNNLLLQEAAKNAPILALAEKTAEDKEALQRDNKQLSTVNAKLLTEAEEREQALSAAEEENTKLREQLQRMESSTLWERITKHWKD